MRWILRIVGSLAGMVVLLLLAALAFYVYASMRVNGELISSGTKRQFLLHVRELHAPSNQARLDAARQISEFFHTPPLRK